MHKIAQEEERLELARMNIAMIEENKGQVPVEQYIEYIKKEKIIDEDTSIIENADTSINFQTLRGFNVIAKLDGNRNVTQIILENSEDEIAQINITNSILSKIEEGKYKIELKIKCNRAIENVEIEGIENIIVTKKSEDETEINIEYEGKDNSEYKVEVTSVDGEIVSQIIKVEEYKISISGLEDFLTFKENVNEKGITYEGETVELVADIDLAEECGAEIGSWIPIGTSTNKFKGIFDGKNHTIKNLYINETTSNYQALFGYVEGSEIEKAEIKNLSIDVSCTVYGKGNVGGIVGRAVYATISNCVNNGEIKGYSTESQGGICGFSSNSDIYRCVNNGDISGYWSVGGICGFSLDTTIKECYNTGKIGKTTTGTTYSFGGIVGCLYINTEMINCYNLGTVTGNSYVGGIAGCNTQNSNIQYCYNLGNVSGSSSVGSVVGRNSNDLTPYANIYKCYFKSGTGNGIGTSTGGTVETTAITAENFADKTNSITSLTYLLNKDNNEPQWTIEDGEYPILIWQIE